MDEPAVGARLALVVPAEPDVFAAVRRGAVVPPAVAGDLFAGRAAASPEAGARTRLLPGAERAAPAPSLLRPLADEPEAPVAFAAVAAVRDRPVAAPLAAAVAVFLRGAAVPLLAALLAALVAPAACRAGVRRVEP